MNILNKKGFTLIELLVVIAIIGVLSTLAIVALGAARTKARNVKRVADIKQIGTALELYYSDNGNYPEVLTPGHSLASPDGNVYLAKIPSNPTPRNDGNCADAEYIYTANSQASPIVYNLSTCISSIVGSNNAGIISSSPIGLFSCGQKIIDADGNQYNTVQIGSQCWMKQNLNVGTTQLCAGLGGTTCATNAIDDTKIEKYCYNNNLTNCTIYGALYQWQEAMALPAACLSTDCLAQIKIPHQGICPTGWHIPTDTEFNTLEKYVVRMVASSATQYNCDTTGTGWQRCADNNSTNAGGAKGAGKSFKAVSQGDDLVGFSALLSGIDVGGSFANLASGAYFWQSTQGGAALAWNHDLYINFSTIYRTTYSKAYGMSIRCLKD